MMEYFLGRILQNSRIDPLSVKANVMLAAQYADTIEEEYKKEDQKQQKKYEERCRVEEENRKQRKIASLKEDITAQQNNFERQAECISSLTEKMNTLKGQKHSLASIKADIDLHQLEYVRTSETLEVLRKELESYEPKPVSTGLPTSVTD
jgi:uncharacterized coiled-coil protein SlyX